jgi:hypothetical protein
MFGWDYRWRIEHGARIPDREQRGKLFASEQFRFGGHHPSMTPVSDWSMVHFAQIDEQGRLSWRQLIKINVPCNLTTIIGKAFAERSRHGRCSGCVRGPDYLFSSPDPASVGGLFRCPAVIHSRVAVTRTDKSVEKRQTPQRPSPPPPKRAAKVGSDLAIGDASYRLIGVAECSALLGGSSYFH